MKKLEEAMPKKTIEVSSPPSCFILKDLDFDEAIQLLSTEERLNAEASGCFKFEGVVTYRKSGVIEV